jgi:cytochrome c-type biogenesis protein CcmH/NrfG
MWDKRMSKTHPKVDAKHRGVQRKPYARRAASTALSLAFIALALSGAGAILCTAANAQPAAPPAMRLKSNFMPSPAERTAYDKAFRATLEKPSDPETLARFAELAIRFGDMEGAISALERLLLIEADQPEVKLELGVLHYRIGSRQAAVFYLDDAQSSPGASPQVQQRAAVFLKAARR